MDYDICIIGAGWAGFNAALTAKKAGLKTALIEKSSLGGTCLNKGCIPTKALIQSAKLYNLIRKAGDFGIQAEPPRIILSKAQERKNRIVEDLRRGMSLILKGVDLFLAEARFTAPDSLALSTGVTLKSKYVIIATGSVPIELPGLAFDAKKIISSEELLDFNQLPQSLLVIGGGVIGCEFACLFSALGSKVTLVEKTGQLLPGEDTDISRRLESTLKKKGIEVRLDTDALAIDRANFELVLVCVGRKPFIGTLEPEKAGIVIEKNRLLVGEDLKTSSGKVFAAGDCAGGIMLAHYAAYQGRLAVENIIAGKNTAKERISVPNCIFTEPEIASAGCSEEELKNKNIAFDVFKSDFMASGMARILAQENGFLKILADKKDGLILGSSIIGPHATELIAGLNIAIQSGLTVRQLKNVMMAHPSLSETIAEALK